LPEQVRPLLGWSSVNVLMTLIPLQVVFLSGSVLKTRMESKMRGKSEEMKESER
jgi:hypothetical protein